jgi:hypothetical protein
VSRLKRWSVYRSLERLLCPIFSKVTELQDEHAEYLAQKKAEALDAVALMEDQVVRKVEQERASDCRFSSEFHHGVEFRLIADFTYIRI